MRRMLALTGAVVVGLAGCAGADEDELKEWMSEVRRDVRPMVQPIPAPKKFEPYVYDRMAQDEPFNPVKIEAALQKLAARSSSGIKPDMDRRREALEAFPLDSLKMVGTLQKDATRVALLRVDGSVFQARVGNYVGQNFGVITRITETDVAIKEIVQDAAGEWVERMSTLQLQENQR
ncbi:pilus assembly protein PilP [Derxia gummosa]|uniref:Pilus assembly protein PilP n=1 Tax=Derxia gummosa DSM 723 TaxID=1121388 RepID=A0A8B6X0Q7_9BURK|nr:pilus assembly protein PilP [Derxia gummosa]